VGIRAELDPPFSQCVDRTERRQKTGQVHFITFSCYQRLPYLQSSESKDVLGQVIERARESYSLAIYAYVLMPEHPANPHLVYAEIWGTRSEAVMQMWATRPGEVLADAAHSCDETA
jgi:hypothetical protein